MSDNYSEKELWEKFTFEGFIGVSLWALYLFIVGLGMWNRIFGWFFEDNSIWQNLGLGYLISWVFCFLFFCLIPKLTDEARGRISRLKNRKTWKKNEKQIEEIVQKDQKNKNPQKRYKK